MKPRATKAGELARERVFRAAMRLYRHWQRIGESQTRPNPWCEPGHWYPLNSEREAKALCRACAAARPRSKPSKPRGKR